jgi:hypothetical protein
MCLNERRVCECGRQDAYLIFRDNLLSPEILVNLYCPECSARVRLDRDTMLQDCGWVLEYDLEGAQGLLARQGVTGTVTPEFLFDAGYLTWQGLSPGDHDVNHDLHRRLAPLVEADLTLYLQSLKSEWLEYVAGLKAAGWRKAQAT